MATTHTEAVLNKLSKPELVKLVPQTKASLASQITNLTTERKDLLGYFKKLEVELAVTKNVNSKPMERVVQIERQCWLMLSTHAETLLKSLVYRRLSEARIWKAKCAIFLKN